MNYEIEACTPVDVCSQIQKQCIELISSGGAVEQHYVEENFPHAHKVVTVTCESGIVGVGVIKQIRTDYASSIASRSGYSFPSDTHELGYITVQEKHRGKKPSLSGQMVKKLLSVCNKPLFATTSSESMKHTLKKAGFLEKGHAWDGNNGSLTLWVKGLP